MVFVSLFCFRVMADLEELVRPVSPLPEESHATGHDKYVEELRRLALASRRSERGDMLQDMIIRAYEEERAKQNCMRPAATGAAATSSTSNHVAEHEVVAASTDATTAAAATGAAAASSAEDPAAPNAFSSSSEPNAAVAAAVGKGSEENPYSNYIAALEKRLRDSDWKYRGGRPRRHQRSGEPVPEEMRRRRPIKRRVTQRPGGPIRVHLRW